MAVTFALVGVAGCGGDDDASDQVDTVDDGAGSGGGDADGGGSADDGSAGDGGDSASSGAGAVDDSDFPIPAPDGLVLDVLDDSGINMEAQGQRQLYYARDDFDRVVTFYDDWTSQDGGWTKGGADGVVVFSDTESGLIRSITVTPEHDPGAQADGPVTFVLLVTNELAAGG